MKNLKAMPGHFPGLDHVSVGICGKAGEEPMAALRARLGCFHAKVRLCSGPAANIQPPVAFAFRRKLGQACGWRGEGWALVGDAAGLVDPVTGEGIYYAMRSGDLLAEALLEGFPQLYPERVRNEFGRALALGARLARCFIRESFSVAASPRA